MEYHDKQTCLIVTLKQKSRKPFSKKFTRQFIHESIYRRLPPNQLFLRSSNASNALRFPEYAVMRCSV